MLSAALVLWLFLRGTALADVLYTIEELLPLPGHEESRAYAVNDSGQVVGYSYHEGSAPHQLYPNIVTATLWDSGAVIALNAPLDPLGQHLGFNALDINNSGQIVGIQSDCSFVYCDKPGDLGFVSGVGQGNWTTVAPGSLASVPLNSDPDCYLDNMFTAISDTGYILGSPSGISSPNMTTQLCGLDILAFYEIGLTLTEIGYVYDPFVDYFYDQGTPIAVNSRQWVVVPTCSSDLTGYALSTGLGNSHPLALEVSDQVAQSICDLTGGEIHNKVMNASGQFILNVGDRAFLYTPCSEFPGGGHTEGCFPGPGTFPAPEPATLALIAIGLAGLGFSRRKRSEVSRALASEELLRPLSHR